MKKNREGLATHGKPLSLFAVHHLRPYFITTFFTNGEGSWALMRSMRDV